MDNKLDYYLSKIERQLDFHRGLHLFEMEMNPNFTNKAVFLKESQEEYITNLFGDNKNIRESYNREFNNVLVESTFNPKDEVKKFFSFLKENYINEIFNSNVLLEQTPKVKTPLKPTQTPVGALGGFFDSVDSMSKKYGEWITNLYKKIYNQLKAGGIGVKWEVANDPVKSKFMYWGTWVIWKDENKNGGWPITFTSTDNKVWLFKFYASDIKRMESKFITSKFNLIDWGKIPAANATKQFNELIISHSMAKKNFEEKLKKDTEATAQNVLSKLKTAFDQDSDGVYDDWDGTNENGALAAINLITTKNILDRVNQLIASSARPYGSLKSWVNDEMSDIDRDTYKAIWDRLGKLGYKGYIQNDFLAATGKGDIVGMVGAGFTWLKDKGIPWFMEKLRDALGSFGGAVVQQLLNLTGVGAIGTTILWAVLTLFDVSQIASGAGTWAKLIFSVLGLLTAGVLAKAIGGFLKPLFNSAGGTLTSFFQKIAQQNWFIKYIKPVVGWIGSKVSGAASLLKQAGDWVVKKLGATTIGGFVTKAAEWLRTISQSIVKFAGFESKQTTAYLAKKDLQKQGNKLITKAVVDPVKDKTKEKIVQSSEYVGGNKGKTAAELALNVANLTKKPQEITKAINKGDIVKTVTTGVKAVDQTGKVIDKGVELATNEPIVSVKDNT